MPNIFERIDQDPAFQRLGFAEQQQVRMKLMEQRVFPDPKFQQLGVLEKNGVINGVMLRPPAYEAQQEFPAQGSGQYMLRGTTALPKGGSFLSNTQRVMGELMQGGGQPELINARIRQGLNRSMAMGVGKVAAQGVTRLFALAGNELPGQIMRDEQKMSRFLTYFADEEEQVLRKHAWIQGAAEVGAAIGDFAALYAVGVGSLAAPKGLALAGQKVLNGLANVRVGQAAAGTARATLGATRAGSFITGRGGQVIVHSMAGGVVEVAREGGLAILGVHKDNPDFKEWATQIPKYWGQGFLWDYLFFGLGPVARSVGKSIGRTFKGFNPKFGTEEAFRSAGRAAGGAEGLGQGVFESLTTKQLRETVMSASLGKDLPTELFNQLRPRQRLAYRRLAAVGQLHRNLDKVVPGSTAETIIQLTRKGWITTPPLEDGTRQLFRTWDEAHSINIPETELREFMGKALTTPDELMSDALRATRREAVGDLRRAFKITTLDTEVKVGGMQVALPSAEGIRTAAKQSRRGKGARGQQANDVRTVFGELETLADESLFIPTLGGEQASDFLMARALWERSALRGTASGIPFQGYMETVQRLRAGGHITGKGAAVEAMPAREAWWLWAPDGAEIMAYRQAADQATDASAAWDTFIYGARRQGRLMPSGRGLVTPGEADQMVKEHGARLAHADPADPLLFHIGDGKGRPTAVLHGQRTAPLEQWQDMLAREGGDVIQTRNRLMADGFDAAAVGDGQIRVFSPGQIRRISNEALTMAGNGRLLQGIDAVDRAAFASSQGPIRITEIVEGQLKGSTVDPMVLVSLLQPKAGVVNRFSIQRFARVYLLDKGVKDSVIKSRLHDLVPEGWRIRTPEDERAAIGALFQELNALARSHGDPSVGATAGRNALEQYRQALEDTQTITPEWVNFAVNKDGGVLTQMEDGKWLIQKQGSNTVYDTLDDVVDSHFRNRLSDDHIVRGIREDMGLIVRPVGDGFEIRRPHFVKNQKKSQSILMENGQVDSIDDVLERTGWRPKLDSTFGPDIAIIERGTRGVRYTQRGVVGNYQDILRELSKFRDPAKDLGDDVALEGFAGILKLNKAKLQYTVEIPQIGHIQTFDKLADAKKYLKEGWKTFSKLEEAALMKGFRLEHHGAGWTLYTHDGGTAPIIVDTLDQLTDELKKVPTPKWAPEISGATEAEIRDMNLPEIPGGMFDPEDLGPTPKMYGGFRKALHYTFDVPDAFFEQISRRGGDVRAEQAFRDIEVAFRAVRSGTHSAQRETQAIFAQASELVGTGKKSRELRQAMLEYTYPSGPGTTDDIAQKWADIGFNNRHRQIAEEWRLAMLKRGEQYGVDPEQFFGGWRNQLKRYFADSRANRRSPDWQAAWGNDPPQEVLEWLGKDMRTQDVLDLVRETDPLLLSDKFHYIGHKKTLGVDAINEARFLVDDGGKRSIKDDATRKRLALYMAEVAGIPASFELAQFRQLSKDLATKFGGGDSELAGAMSKSFGNLFRLGYLATMGWRPWLPIRNQFQIWTTLSLHAPNHVIAEALTTVMKAKEGDKIIGELIEKGITRPFGVPVFGEDQVGGRLAQGLIRSRSRFAPLAAYRSSDEITRAVAYHSAKIQFTSGLTKMRKLLDDGVDRVVAEKQFMSLSGLDTMPKEIRDRSRALLKDNRVSSALDVYAAHLIDITMFPYRAGSSPKVFTGMVGKLFGMFGTYPAYYAENIRRAWRNTPPLRRAAAFTRFMGNNAAIYLGLREVFGVDAPGNFMPWQQVIFTGGPYYQMMNDALNAIGPSYRAQLARKELMRNLPTLFVPGSLALKNAVEGIDLMDRGEGYLGLLKILSMPVRKDWLEEAR